MHYFKLDKVGTSSNSPGEIISYLKNKIEILINFLKTSAQFVTGPWKSG